MFYCLNFLEDVQSNGKHPIFTSSLEYRATSNTITVYSTVLQYSSARQCIYAKHKFLKVFRIMTLQT